MKIKGFDENLCCRGMQFKIGKVYDTGADETELQLCSDTVFHYCDHMINVNHFYPVDETNRFCEIQVLGREITDGIKCGSNKIKILREIEGDELDALIGKINGNTGVFNSGQNNSGNFNSGNGNSGHCNSGCDNSGNCNGGHRNSGYSNSGNCNSGSYNSGHGNNGDCNSGNCNSGWYNTGEFNRGWGNSGSFNACDGSNGFFNVTPDKVRVFEIQTNMTRAEFRSSEYYEALTSVKFPLTEWKDKKLITHTYEEACAIWWNNLTEENKEIIKKIPNFNKDIFKEITGIKIE